MRLVTQGQQTHGSNKSYRPDIDGLRAIAVLAVVGFHCGIPWLRGGFIGVDVFFVISGYLICSIIYKELQQRRFSIAEFYKRRFKRILPALFVVLFFCLGMAALVLSPYEAYRLGMSAVATALSASNLFFIRQTGYFAGNVLTNPLLMTWSLAVEEQFYIVFPLMLLLLRNKTKRSLLTWLACLCAISFALSVYAEFRLPVWNFYLPVTRAWELGAGTLLAIWHAGRQDCTTEVSWKLDVRGAVGILLVVGSILLYRPGMRFPGYEAFPPVLGSVLILASPGCRANRVLAIRPLVAVGLISYSLYLWHWPLLSFAEILSAKPLRPQTVVILMVVAFVAAIGTYFLVEKPFRAPSKAKTGRVLITYAAAIAILVMVSGEFFVARGLPWRYPSLYQMESEAALYRHHPCITASDLRLTDYCMPRPNASLPTLAVLGDSHAEALAEGLRDFVSRQGWQLAIITHESCPPTLGVTAWSSENDSLAGSCHRFNQSTLDYVRSRPDIRVVLLTARWADDYAPDQHEVAPHRLTAEQNALYLRNGLQAEVDALESAGKKVVLVEDVPSFPYDPVAGVRNQQIRLRRKLNQLLQSEEPGQGDGSGELRALTLTAGAELATKQIRDLQAADARLTVIDPKKALCHGERCYFADGLNLYYYDTMHLSRRGAMKIVPLLPDLNTIY